MMFNHNIVSMRTHLVDFQLLGLLLVRAPNPSALKAVSKFTLKPGFHGLLPTHVTHS